MTILDPVTGYFMNSGSKFHAYIFPVLNEAEALVHLQALKKAHPKARHFCTAIRLLPDGSFSRSSDDGEPAGSAGKPILNQLLKYNLTCIYAVVVRYFGGTKLGIPGLIEAYKTSTEDALSNAKLISRALYVTVQITLPFESYPAFLNFLMQRNVQVTDSEFDRQATLMIALRASAAEVSLTQLMRDYTQLDFDNPEQYAAQLGWQITFLPGIFIQ